MKTSPSGVEAAATYAGGFARREATHAEEVACGQLWRRCGAVDEVGPLREVLLSWPSARLATPGDPDAWLFVSWPDLRRLEAQHERIAAFYEAQGVVVHVMRPEEPPPPNALFMRDLAFLTPEGAVLARPAAAVRAGEERFAAAALAGLGVPILRTLRGAATFEGADALWLDARTVMIGVGRRTNAAGFEAVARVLAEQGVDAVPIPLPSGVQHLLGVVVPLDRDLAAVRASKAPPALHALLADRGVREIALSDDDDMICQRGMNLVCLAPRVVVMPDGAPVIRAALEAAGVSTCALDVSEYLAAGGGLGCLTSVLLRDPAPVSPATP